MSDHRGLQLSAEVAKGCLGVGFLWQLQIPLKLRLVPRLKILDRRKQTPLEKVMGADSATPAASAPTMDIVRQQRLVSADKTEDRATRRSLADPAENVGPQSAPWDCVITEVGQEFDNVKAFRDELCKYAFVKGFTFKYIKNDNVRVTVKCTVVTCPWRIHASGSARKQKFMIKKFNNIHTWSRNW
ncbi:hypothetical protein COCNU_contig69255988G000010 [Cocos nucifera]|nr:hypothetical protein [Cocos nucifera]